MILSHKHKFIYVKGRKVASTSIEIVLSLVAGPSDIVTPISPADELHRLSLGGQCQNFADNPELERHFLDLVRQKKFGEAHATGVLRESDAHFYNHIPLSAIEARVSAPLNQYSIVVSERNPYGKIISLANMALSYSKYQGEVVKNSMGDIQGVINQLFQSGQFIVVRNTHLYTSGRQYGPLYVLRQENLEADLAQLFDELKLGKCVDPLPYAKRGIDSNQFDPREVFTRQQLDQINEAFADEFRLFDYEMV